MIGDFYFIFKYTHTHTHTHIYIFASLIAQLVKNLPAMWETWVQSLGWVDPLEEVKAYFFFLYIFFFYIQRNYISIVFYI